MLTRMKALLALASGLLVGLLAGCSDRRPHYKAETTAAASTAAGARPVAPPTSGVVHAPVSTASTTTAPAGSASVAAPASPAAPVAQAGPGGLSGPATRTIAAATTPITIGPGPVLGSTARGDVRQHLRDWGRADLRALDPIDARLASDGLRESRELVAFYSRRDQGRLCLRVDLLDLRYGAELGGLDLVVLLGWSGAGQTALPLQLRETTAHPWDAALVVEDSVRAALLDRSRQPVAGAAIEQAWRADLDAIELAVPEAALRGLGWTGQELTFQVLAVKDGERRADDALLEVDLLDRSLDEATRESWVADRAGVLAPVVVGNRAALPANQLVDLVWSTRTTTSEGFPTGLRRTVEAHAAHGLPVTVHLTGALMTAIGWARSPDPRADGPAFLARTAQLWDGDPTNGEGAYVPGTYADAILPFFEGAPNARFHALALDAARAWLNVTAQGPVFWAPERVLAGSSLGEVRALGYTHTVLDRTHLGTWFNQAVTDGKLHRVNGVDCFVVDPGFGPGGQLDGGPELRLRTLLLERALDPEPHQAVVLVADWEEFAGQKGNPDVADVWERTLQWLAQRPWIEVATLPDLARRGWSVTDHGQAASLPVEAHEWLRHACEERYDHWYYGHPAEESFAALRPVVRHGRPYSRAMGDVKTAGTLLGDLWGRIQAAPQGGLRTLAETALAGAMYRTAWHQEDNHDLTRHANGQYLSPDTSYDRLTAFAHALSTHVGDAAIVARAAAWAAAPPAQPRVLAEDADLDGEEELLLADDRLLLVLEKDGGRVVAGFARDAAGEAFQVLGAPLSFPEQSAEAGWENPWQTAPRSSTLKDVWLSGPGRDYVNDAMIATVSTTSVGVSFRSSDGLLEKSVAFSGPGRVEVSYRLDPTAGTLSVRCGLAPDLLGLSLRGQAALVETDQGGVYRLEARGARTVAVAITYGTARRNASASDGFATSPRTCAYQHLVELQGDAPGFSFGLGVEVR